MRRRWCWRFLCAAAGALAAAFLLLPWIGVPGAVMFPAAFFAGMTLPLFTMALLRRGYGEKSIGRIYAANTLGAIVGVVLAMHVLVPLLGLRLAVTLAALADVVLGLVLLRAFSTLFRPKLYFGALASVLIVASLSLLFGAADPRALASGVFRHGVFELAKGTDVQFLRDGKTATVAFYRQGSIGTIATNGKPDASIELSEKGVPTDDEYTMVMAASLPLALHAAAERVAVIGWGSGLSTHTLLGSEVPRVVDTIEIEAAMHALMSADTGKSEWLDAASVIADFSIGYLTPADLQGVWIQPAWVGERANDPEIAAVLAAYEATAKRDAVAMYDRGVAGLKAVPGTAPALVRDHLLVIAMLGAIGQDKGELAVALERDQGASVRVSNEYYWLARSYIPAWLHATGRVKKATRSPAS